MSARLAVTYRRTFTRDPVYYRILVALCLALSAGHTAAICAYLFNFISMDVIDISGDRALQTNTYITGRTFTAASMCVAEAFFIVRLFTVTRSILVRWSAIVFWLGSTGVMIWWSVERTKNQRLYPVVRSKLGIAGLLTECLLLLTSALVAFVIMRQLPRVRPPEELPKTRRQKFLYYATLFIESSGLLTFDHLISTVSRFFALGFPTATIITNYFYYLFPSISVFSVAFAINQRPPPPLPPPGSTGLSASKMGGTTSFNPPAVGGGEDFESLQLHELQQQQQQQHRSFLAATARAGGTEMLATASAATCGLGCSAAAGGTIIYDPDDPQTWRGDAQRVFPAADVQFDEFELASLTGGAAGGAGGVGGGDEFPLTRMPSRPGTVSGKSLLSSAPSIKSSRGTHAGRPGFGSAGGDSRDGFAGRSFIGSATVSAGGGRAEYDEELVDMDATVVSLDLGALATVREASSSWGPATRVKEEEEERLEDFTTPTTGSPSSTSDPDV
ncbi:hypothetical protein JCM11251_000331 [Rhodosporidiobolus azoricus]